MTLTRHFYVLEEVAAALRQACIQHSFIEAHFWLQELIDSDEALLAISTLVETYILYYGVSRLEWLRQAHKAFAGDTISVDALIDACTALCRLEDRDASFVGLHILMSYDKAPPDVVTSDAMPIECMNVEEEYFVRAVLQGKVRAALWIAGSDAKQIVASVAALRGAEVSEMVHIIEELPRWSSITIGPKSILCLQCMVLGLRDAELKRSFKPFSPTAAVVQEREEWAQLLGRRSRRLYTPHWSAYYLETRRGRMSYKSSTMSELLQLGGTADATYGLLRGCNHWDELLEECIQYGQGDNDEIFEKFCAEAFPDDIPDEWSAADRERSHGSGLSGGAEDSATVRKWLQRFSWNGARYLYGCEATIMGFVADQGRKYGPDEPWSPFEWLADLPCKDHTINEPNDLVPHTVQYIGPSGPLEKATRKIKKKDPLMIQLGATLQKMDLD